MRVANMPKSTIQAFDVEYFPSSCGLSRAYVTPTSTLIRGSEAPNVVVVAYCLLVIDGPALNAERSTYSLARKAASWKSGAGELLAWNWLTGLEAEPATLAFASKSNSAIAASSADNWLRSVSHFFVRQQVNDAPRICTSM